MDLSLLKNFNKEAWYRGHKLIKVISYSDNLVKLSNNDEIKVDGDKLYINKQLISNIPDITKDEIINIYIDFLKNKGYKFLNF